MHQILTLVAGTGRSLENRHLATAEATLASRGMAMAPPDWLADGLACDLPLRTAADLELSAGLAADLRRRLAGDGIDFALQRAEARRKGLLVADMDSTIVTGETLDELADEAGIKAHIAAITARAMNGELDFKAALRERVALLADLPAAALERTFSRIELTPGAATLVRTMRAHSAFTLLVSGGFRYFTSRIRALAGFDRDEANDLEIASDKLTGRVREPILDRDAKAGFLRAAAAERGIEPGACIAIGDGANDLPMIQLAGLGIAFRAKPAVAAACRVRIEHGDLTTALFFQGYRKSDFAE